MNINNENNTIKPRLLILGGVGFIGRNLVHYLIENNLCSYIKVADKSLPVIAHLHSIHEESFNSPIVEFSQVDLTKEDHRKRIFNNTYDVVINLAAETRYGQTSNLYQSRCQLLSRECAYKAREVGIKQYIEISTAMIYKSSSSSPRKEDSATSAHFLQSSSKLLGELDVIEALLSPSSLKYPGLPPHLTILRPVFVYGPGDINGLMPRIVCAASYIEIKETMKFLWDKNMRINTVHVLDVVQAIWFCIINKNRIDSGSKFNLCDKNDTNQGKINNILEDIFNIKISYVGSFLSNVARMRMDDVVDSANEKHLMPWNVLCQQHNILNTPLSPFMCKELLENHHVYVDGSAIERIGFKYNQPIVTEDLIKQSIKMAIEAEIFPNII